MKKLLYIIIILQIITFAKGQKVEVNWGKFSPKIFEQSRKEKKIILLNLKANWCHWCHVMEDSTYSNSEIIEYLNLHYITVEADQDANPELSSRYKEYGWPATIFLNSKGKDIVKRAGYIGPINFMKLLKAIVKDPTPESNNIRLSEVKINNNSKKESLQILKNNFEKTLDYNKGGYNQAQKYIDFDAYEYALFYSNDKNIRKWLKQSVNGAEKLSDPAWGGIYQYSTHFDWNYPHFEKLLDKQARYIKIFTLSYMYERNKKSLEKAKQIVEYADRFLWQNGLYANSQDADLVAGEHSSGYFKKSDKERIKFGIPRVDTNTYTFNNAEFAQSLFLLASVSQDETYYKKAMKITNNLLQRNNGKGLYYHGNDKRYLFSLKDNLAMAELLIDRVKFGNDSLFASKLDNLIETLVSNFQFNNGTFKSFIGELGLEPEPIVNENIKMARILNWYSHYTKKHKYKKMATNIFDFLVNPVTTKTYYSEPAILSLAYELEVEPYSLVYYKPDNNSNYLNKSKAMLPFYSLISIFGSNNIPDDKKDYVVGFEQDVILICTSTFCSSPMYNDKSIQEFFKSKMN